MKKYISYLDNISVDENLHDKIMQNLTDRQKPLRQKKSAVFRYAGVAACAMIILLACVWIVPGVFGERLDFEPLYIGLPVDDFILTGDSGGLDTRIIYKNLYDFFRLYNSVPDMFAVVRVVETEQKTDKNPRFRSEWQVSSAEVLSVLWNRYGNIPETISVISWKRYICGESASKNLIREGGVYLLPLCYSPPVGVREEEWHITGDVGVLFEIDDKGRVWSHSPFDGFNKFDGGDARILADALNVYVSDENFSAAVSRFGMIIREPWWDVLIEATHLSVTENTNEYDNIYYEHFFRVENILTSENLYCPAAGGEIKTISHDSLTKIHLEEGGKYLMFFTFDETGPYMASTGGIAKINVDGTISEIFTPRGYGHRAFDEYNGYTVGQMQEEARKAITWHEKYGE
jgi:hypothetical protein